ncbi:unnamed protein product, partial [Ixodes hexagonus]
MAAASKAQAFTFEVPPDTPVDAIIDGIHCIVGAEGLQYLQHQGGPRFLAVVSSMANAGKMVAQGSLRLGNVEVPLIPVGPHVLYVSVFRLPPYVPDEALLTVLTQYGKVLQVTHAAYKDHPNIKTGTRVVRMEMAKPVPNFINVRGHRVMVDYKGLRKVCFRCSQEGHVGSGCTTPRCARCNVFGHPSEGCQAPCRRCGHNHATADCTEKRAYSVVAQEFTSTNFPPLVPADVAPNHTLPAPTTRPTVTPDTLGTTSSVGTTSSIGTDSEAEEPRLVIDEGDHGHPGGSPLASSDTPSTSEPPPSPSQPTSASGSASATTTTESDNDIMDYRLLDTKRGRPETSDGSSEGQPPRKFPTRLPLKK